MSDNQRLRTRRQVLSAMVKKFARNPTKPSPEKLHHSGVVDLCESSQPSSSRSKSLRNKKTASIDEIFPDPLPNSTEEDRDAEVVADSEDEEQRSQEDMQDQLEADGEDEAQQDEENCPDPMETLGELDFVNEELELLVYTHRARHQAGMAATPTLRKPLRRPFDATFYS
ncbi:hypothetical protein F2Q69_00059091 [Brassica cretica]|uniref:Uncharacterized protein n=1 Tax=Brassica cretica TaxID=69181 RepID=A0A8S9RIX2_BRACR|nr:hypothetical protein F2Q69_00059091 [Brassica cretica]